MTKSETIERLQFLALVLGLTLSVAFLALTDMDRDFSVKVNRDVALATSAMALLLMHNLLHFSKLNARELLLRSQTYLRPGLLLSFAPQVLLADLMLSPFSSLHPQYNALHLLAMLPIIFLLAIMNFYLPVTWQGSLIERQLQHRQNRTLISLRRELQRKTADLLSSSILPELDRIRAKDSDIVIEDALGKALLKIDGIEEVLRYIVLDKYLELLEKSDGTAFKRTSRKWTMRSLIVAVIIELALIAVRTFTG